MQEKGNGSWTSCPFIAVSSVTPWYNKHCALDWGVPDHGGGHLVFDYICDLAQIYEKVRPFWALVGTMVNVYRFAAVRPAPGEASSIAAVRYDVVTAEEARTIIKANPVEFSYSQPVRRGTSRHSSG